MSTRRLPLVHRWFGRFLYFIYICATACTWRFHLVASWFFSILSATLFDGNSSSASSWASLDSCCIPLGTHSCYVFQLLPQLVFMPLDTLSRYICTLPKRLLSLPYCAFTGTIRQIYFCLKLLTLASHLAQKSVYFSHYELSPLIHFLYACENTLLLLFSASLCSFISPGQSPFPYCCCFVITDTSVRDQPN